MVKNICRVLTLGLLAGGVLGTSLRSLGAEGPATNAPPTAEKAAPAKPAKKARTAKSAKSGRSTTFRGTITAVDNIQKTITVLVGKKTRTLQITSKTRLFKAGEPATFGDAKVDGPISGRASFNAEGKGDATRVNLGAKGEAKGAAKAKRKTSKTKKTPAPAPATPPTPAPPAKG